MRACVRVGAKRYLWSLFVCAPPFQRVRAAAAGCTCACVCAAGALVHRSLRATVTRATRRNETTARQRHARLSAGSAGYQGNKKVAHTPFFDLARGAAISFPAGSLSSIRRLRIGRRPPPPPPTRSTFAYCGAAEGHSWILGPRNPNTTENSEYVSVLGVWSMEKSERSKPRVTRVARVWRPCRPTRRRKYPQTRATRATRIRCTPRSG